MTILPSRLLRADRLVREALIFFWETNPTRIQEDPDGTLSQT